MSHGSAVAAGVLLIAVGVGAWLLSLRFRPYKATCVRCGGSGRIGTKRGYRRCPRCKGKPERLRFGARAMNRNLR